jgi:Rod binding domain-containing protein
MISSTSGASAAGVFSAQSQMPSQPSVVNPAGDNAEYAATRQVANKFVNQTFFGTLMREMRKSASTDHEMNGGHGEDIMGPELDQALVDRMSKGQNFKLSDAVADQLYRHTHASRGTRSTPSVVNGGGL